jgi:predicted RNA polymerase sigma factor
VRLAAVLHVLYLIFTEGHTASSGASLQRVELSAEALRLVRQLRAAVPDDGEVAGLLALMLLTDARRPSRTTAEGNLVPLAEQDRSRWDAAMVAEGTALLDATLPVAEIGPYQLQAAIAPLHDTAPTAADTDWRQILGLYGLLGRVAPGPMVTLNRIVALAMVRGPEAGLAELDRAEADPALAGHHRVDAVRAHLLEELGNADAAAEAYRRAAGRTLSIPERRYLEERARAATARSG